MNKKHQQAFRELREWCKKYGVWIGVDDQTNEVWFTIGVDDNNSPGYYSPGDYAFTERTEILVDHDKTNHSI